MAPLPDNCESPPSMPSQGEHSRTDIEFHVLHAPLYDQEVTSEYEVYDDSALAPFLDRFARHGPRLTALDLGCGTGAVTLHLIQRGFKVHAIDHSPDMIAIAKEKVQLESAAANVTFHVGEAWDLPFESDQFDLVTCQRVLHHIPDVQPVVAEVKRVLKPGGSFYLSDGVADSTPLAATLRSLWRAVLPKLREPETLHHPPPGHEVLRRIEDFRRLLDGAGFSYELRFFTHVGLQRYLSTRQRAVLIRLLSAPWKRRRGDMLFAYASSQPAGSGQLP